MKWLVLGLGNPLAGADAFGPAVIARLGSAVRLPDGVELVDAHTDLLAYLHRFADHDGVVLVDAALSADGHGVTLVDEETFVSWDDRSLGAHEWSPVAVVKLFRCLHPHARTCVFLVACVVPESDFAAPPRSEAVEAGVHAVYRLIDRTP